MKKIPSTPSFVIPSMLASLLLAACGGAPPTAGAGDGAAAGARGGASGGSITDFTLNDIDGRSVSLSDFLGEKVILVSFWATWCEPCKKEMVQLQALYEAHAAAGLQILSISMDEPETQGDARSYIKQRGYTFPVLLDTETLVTNQLNPRRAAPFTLIISKGHEVVWEHESYVPGDERKIEEAVLSALGRAVE
jgi:peroxiredoxin